MEELNRGGQLDLFGVVGIAKCAGAEQGDQRSNAFTATGNQILANIFDQADIGD